jgi:hypothetical protein
VDFSALSAQAVAQVEKARQAAQQQIAAAFQEKPQLSLRLHLEAPKIAIPVPSTFDDQGKRATTATTNPTTATIATTTAATTTTTPTTTPQPPPRLPPTVFLLAYP